jgi:hypothetical protein
MLYEISGPLDPLKSVAAGVWNCGARSVARRQASRLPVRHSPWWRPAVTCAGGMIIIVPGVRAATGVNPHDFSHVVS